MRGDLPDNELAALAGGGDTAAYRQLFERYQHPVYNFVYRLVDNAEDASDIVQDAFIKVHGVLGQREVRNFSAYLYRTARNLAFDEMRRRSRFAGADQELLAPEDPNIYADPQRALLLQEQIGKVRAAMRGLSDNQQAALILRELEGLDYEQMSEVLESNRNAVGALLSRARLRFREELRMAQVQTGSRPPQCEEIIALLSAYIDGELAPAEAQRVDAHIAECTFCAAALEEMESASRSFRAFIPVVPPRDLARAFGQKLEQVSGQGPQSGGDGANALLRHLAGHKAFYMSIAALLITAAAGLLLAEQSAFDPSGEALDVPLANTVHTSTDRAVANYPGPASTPALAPAAETADQTEPPASSSESGPQSQPAPVQPSPFSITSGGASQATVYERDSVRFRATISGAASIVSVRMVDAEGSTAGVINLVRGSSSGGVENWGMTVAAGPAGNFTLYIDATGTEGQQTTYEAGSLEIRTGIY